MAYPVIPAVRVILLASVAVSALAGDRISALEREREEEFDAADSPSIVLSIVSAPTVRTIDGPAAGIITRVAVVCRAASYQACTALHDAALDVLDGYRGRPVINYGPIRCWVGTQADGLEDSGSAADPDGTQVVRRTLDLMFKRI